ncbi:aminoglycoside phosphotransferase family protein [Streptomyces sp. DSM 44915]|uniref:Aminoglycoside phosphotransferase family protein n=1 Tax=Streptomyces chisholmiae TaxID=3075540 RepID=A0ABU2JTJ4_9ACTN|nr:aminoglycoside phosphotransferase family protein [Streptomyces sp. DSM 44915]MDT0268237.1 aminoglycoside phosphotransferase family protein [Streptomyces sp. DSM 44915]
MAQTDPDTTGETPLTGGNVSGGVVRIGDTVRRPAGPWTPAVHALLHHLHAVGFTGAPRPLGIDAQGREVLTFAPGSTAWPDRFGLLDPTGRLARVGRLIRELHDAAAEFTPPPDAAWRRLIPPDGTEQIVHHDLAPWNLVLPADAELDVGDWQFIDWDGAGPGTRLGDLAYAAHGFLPLSANPAFRRTDRDAADRLRVLADAYGLDETQRRAWVPLLTARTLAMHDFLRDQTAAGVEPWTTLWREGHGTVWRQDAEYVEARAAHWRAALLD